MNLSIPEKTFCPICHFDLSKVPGKVYELEPEYLSDGKLKEPSTITCFVCTTVLVISPDWSVRVAHQSELTNEAKETHNEEASFIIGKRKIRRQ